LRYYEALFLEGYNFTRGDAWDGEIEVQEVRPYSTDYLVTLLLKPRKGDTEDVGLRIRRKPESYFGFKIIDVLYKGVSLLVTQRADFASTLRKEGVAGLIKKIEEKVGYEEEIIDIPG
jgi:ABC-type transporter MlaC component